MSPLVKSAIRQTLRGYVIVPMITPITPSGDPDASAARRLADHILGGGCQGLMAGGTNGEGPSFSVRQRLAHIETTAAHAGSRGRVFAGIGSAAFADAVELGRASLAAGAAAVVIHPAPYFSSNPAELEAYYLRLIEAIGGPLFLYNIPATTRVSIPLDVVERLSRHPLVLGIKDSEGDAARQQQLADMHKHRADFTVFCGSAAFSLRSMRAGGDGSVPSAGNIDPAACRRLVDLGIAAPDSPEAGAAQKRADNVALIYQQGRQLPAQISALKACASLLGLCARDAVPPLLTCNNGDIPVFREKLKALGLVS